MQKFSHVYLTPENFGTPAQSAAMRGLKAALVRPDTNQKILIVSSGSASAALSACSACARHDTETRLDGGGRGVSNRQQQELLNVVICDALARSVQKAQLQTPEFQITSLVSTTDQRPPLLGKFCKCLHILFHERYCILLAMQGCPCLHLLHRYPCCTLSLALSPRAMCGLLTKATQVQVGLEHALARLREASFLHNSVQASLLCISQTCAALHISHILHILHCRWVNDARVIFEHIPLEHL